MYICNKLEMVTNLQPYVILALEHHVHALVAEASPLTVLFQRSATEVGKDPFVIVDVGYSLLLPAAAVIVAQCG